MPRIAGQTLELTASDRVLAQLAEALNGDQKRIVKLTLGVMNRTLKSGRTAMSGDIRKTINLPKKRIDKYIRTKITYSDGFPSGALRVFAARPELVDYMSPRQIAAAWAAQNRQKRRSKGVKIRTRKDRPAKVYTGAFVNIGTASRQWHVMSRLGPSRDSAKVLLGPEITIEFEKRLPRFAAGQADKFNGELERVLSRRLEILR